MVVEADESDGTFTRLPATIAVVTNIDPEHLDYYGEFDALQQAFETFVGNIPFYGFAVLCIDHPVVQGMVAESDRPAHPDLRLQPAGRYPRRQYPAWQRRQPFRRRHRRPRQRRRRGRSPTCSCRCSASTTCRTRWPRSPSPRRWASATRSCATALRKFERRQAPLHQDRRVERRHDHRRLRPPPGRDRGGAESRARAIVAGRVIAVVQPHRYTRLADLFDGFCTCFNDADIGAGRRRLRRRRGADRGHRAATRWSPA